MSVLNKEVSLLYKVGEKIVYPMHGAGIITSFEEKEVLGSMQKYYVLEISGIDATHLVPVATADAIGVRPVIKKDAVDKIYKLLSNYKEEDTSNWNKRYRENLRKMKTGVLEEVAKVVSSLSVRETEKPLSTSEKKMLNNATNILVSELSLATDETDEKIHNKIKELLSL